MGELSSNSEGSEAAGVDEAGGSPWIRSDLLQSVGNQPSLSGGRAALASRFSAVSSNIESCTDELPPAGSPRSVTRYYQAVLNRERQEFAEKLRERDQLLEFEKGFMADERAASLR